MRTLATDLARCTRDFNTAVVIVINAWAGVVVMRGVIDKAGGAVSSDVAIVGRTLGDVRKKKNLLSGRVDVDSGGL